MFDTRVGRVSTRQRSKLQTSCGTTGGSLTFLRERSRAGPRARVVASQQKHSAKHALIYKTFKDKTAGGAKRDGPRRRRRRTRPRGKVFPSGRRGEKKGRYGTIPYLFSPSLTPLPAKLCHDELSHGPRTEQRERQRTAPTSSRCLCVRACVFVFVCPRV